MKNIMWGVIACVAFVGLPAHAQMPELSDERLAEIERQLFVELHSEYRRCLTTLSYNCAKWNDDYQPIEKHGPSVSNTLTWIGNQLKKRNLVHFFTFEGCKIAFDTSVGEPKVMTWRDKSGETPVWKQWSIIGEEIFEDGRAEQFLGIGYYAYLRKGFRKEESSEKPRKLVVTNDAAIMDLSRIVETKSLVVTDEKGNLVLRDAPYAGMQFHFKQYANKDTVFNGTHFMDESQALLMGPSSYPDAGQNIEMFNGTYIPFDEFEQDDSSYLHFTQNDVDFALKMAKAFRHVIEHCELESPQPEIEDDN